MSESIPFRIGPVEFRGQPVVCLTDSTMQGFPSGGVTGYSLFGHWTVQIDYDRMTIILHEPGTFQADSTWTVVPMELHKNNMPWLKLRASLDARDTVDLDCYIDLPEREAVMFLVQDGAKLRMPKGLELSHLGRGLSGDVRGWKGRAAFIALDTFRFKDVPVAFAPAETRSKQPGAEAVIGCGLLRHFNTVYDFAGRKLYIRPNKRQ
jgi:hypothetical protein